jgi:Lipocalin-like domain
VRSGPGGLRVTLLPRCNRATGDAPAVALKPYQPRLSTGAHPTGYLSYGPDCRMYAIIVRENRKQPAGVVPTDVEKIELFGRVLAYAGTYTIDGDKVSHHVDVSWNEAWTGTTQVRQFKIEGKALHIRSMPAKNPRDGKLSSSTIVWTKVE